jgi:hypothetical protein
MKNKAMNAIHNAMPTLKEMKQRLQQARFGGEIPKVRSCARTIPRFCPLAPKMLTKNELHLC